ncbi:MAG: cysteine desulfurase [Mogibacterium sp.]|nr:cysteine desulfurase [Mogibacterium sp.]
MIYLDNSSTTRQYDEVTQLMYDVAMNTFGNPSSLHALGYEASNVLKEARERTARCFPAGGEIFFNSGGTEGDNTALVSACRKMKRRGKRIITTAVEHPAILEVCKQLVQDGYIVEKLPVDSTACICTDDLRSALTEDTVIVSVMSVNNEVGTIEPVLACNDIVRAFNEQHGTGILFHTDAVQAFSKLDLRGLPCDMISVSGHKFHGPKGVGALYVKRGTNIGPFVNGGGQESGMRSGTENLPGVAGLGLACEMSCAGLEDKMRRMAEVNDYLRNGLLSELPDVLMNGPEEQGLTYADAGKRCPGVLNLSFLGTRGEVLLHTIEQDGIYVSTGSACHSHKTGDSYVLTAMGRTHKEIEGAIRFSFNEFQTVQDMDFVIDKVTQAVRRFRKLGSFR